MIVFVDDFVVISIAVKTPAAIPNGSAIDGSVARGLDSEKYFGIGNIAELPAAELYATAHHIASQAY